MLHGVFVELPTQQHPQEQWMNCTTFNNSVQPWDALICPSRAVKDNVSVPYRSRIFEAVGCIVYSFA